MPRRSVFPFLTLSASSVEISPWALDSSDGNCSLDGNTVEGWDYASTLKFKRKLTVSYEKAAAELGLAIIDMKLAARVLIGTGSGTLPRNVDCAYFKGIEASGSVIDLRLNLPSSQLSERVQLTTQVLLGNRPENPTLLSPLEPGSRLWEDHTDFRLGRADPVFPMEYVSFNSMFGGGMQSGALWYLSWSPDALERDFRGAVRLYLNEDRTGFVDRIDAQDAVVLQMILGDVICQITEQALHVDEDGQQIATLEDNTVGGHVRRWLLSAFGNATHQQIKSVLELRPSDFRARMQSVAELSESER